MTLEPGQIFAHFKIIRKIGEGGMGEVYLAEDQKLNRQVALKLLPAEFCDHPDRLARFAREAKTAAQISHANVTAIHDLGEADDRRVGCRLTYIVMEYIRGQTLTDYLRTHNPAIKELLRLAEKIASGLAAAHQLNIVHRDIKPDNIRIDDQGDPKILDFGLAKPLDPATAGGETQATDTAAMQLTQEGRILGTVCYMSPEQARSGVVDTRSDIFAFGILLYQMFSGARPFDGPDRVSVLARILETKHPSLRQKNEAVPPELERIVDKCLQKDPAERYQDTRDLVVDLRSLRRQYESGISDSGPQPGGVPHKKTLLHRLGRMWAIISLIVVMTIIAAVALVFFGERSGHVLSPALQAKERALAILNFENRTDDPKLDWLTGGLPEMLMTNLAQSGVIGLISRNRLLDYLGEEPGKNGPSQAEWTRAAKALGATAILNGSFYKQGERIRIDAHLEDMQSGSRLTAEKVIGNDPFTLVDSLTQKIAQLLNVKELLADNCSVSTFTSSSPEAYQEYLLGMQNYERGLDDEAIAHFQKAMAVDSTFALPWLRIGMVHVFRGRQQQSMPYFAAAKRFADKLPVRERNLLDIYADTWFKGKFNEAFVKLKTFVSNYPDDREARLIYAVYLDGVINDHQAAMAQFDTVLAQDPKYQRGLEWYAETMAHRGEPEKALPYAQLDKQYHPDSPGPYRTLAYLYQLMQRYPDAIRESEELLKRFPDDYTALTRLIALEILNRDFTGAREHVETLRKKHGNDPYLMLLYCNTRANLADWEGKFSTGQTHRHQGLQWALKSGDSSRVNTQYSALAKRYLSFGRPDSASVFNAEARRWAVGFQNLNYAFILIEADLRQADSARAFLLQAVADFKSRVPSELWTVADNLLAMFDGLSRSDTAAMIAGYEEMLKTPSQQNVEEYDELGRLLVLTGQYEKGKQNLARVLSGPIETTSGFTYLRALYYTGIANEGLHNTSDAIANYKEVLAYWGKPEIEIKEIADTRKRLARLVA